MLATTRQIRLSNGLEFTTPLLIPGLSSRAVGPIPIQTLGERESPLQACSLVHSEALVHGTDDSLLVSAYDIYHNLLVDSSAFSSGFQQSRYSIPRLLVIDSGWYEKNGGPPAGQFAGDMPETLNWQEHEYIATIDGLDEDLTPIVVNWDHLGSYEEQIGHAQSFFGSRPTVASTLLLKPPQGRRFHRFRAVSDDTLANLRAFDVIGVTEREVGESILDRLQALTELRERLYRVDVDAPIHVFGGLDPLYTPLYFAAGAEVFDGLGWLRYAYREGVAMHRDAAVLLDRQSTKRSLQSLNTVSFAKPRRTSSPNGRLTPISLHRRLVCALSRFVHGANHRPRSRSNGDCPWEVAKELVGTSLSTTWKPFGSKPRKGLPNGNCRQRSTLYCSRN